MEDKVKAMLNGIKVSISVELTPETLVALLKETNLIAESMELDEVDFDTDTEALTLRFSKTPLLTEESFLPFPGPLSGVMPPPKFVSVTQNESGPDAPIVIQKYDTSAAQGTGIYKDTRWMR